MAQGKFEKKPEKKAPKKMKLWVKILIGILVVILALAAAVVFAVNYVLGRLGSFDDQPGQTIAPGVVDTTPFTDEFDVDSTIEGQETIPTVDASDVTFGEIEVLEGEDIVNVMLIGQDARPGEGRSRSDTMILISLNKTKGAIQMTSFMRDTYVQIPGYLDNRLNVAYRYGGVELMNETFKLNFGLEIDGNVMVNFSEFSTIIDLMGGVDMELSREEVNYLYNCGHTHLKEGMNHLSGEEALNYARMRYVSGGDYGRTERQRKVLIALANSVSDSSAVEILDMINNVLPHVVTNLSNGQIIDYATTGLKLLANGAEIQTLRIPADDAHYGAMIRNMSVLVPDLQMCREDLQEFIYSGKE